MSGPQNVRYVRLGTQDLAGAKDFATRILGLEHVRSGNNCDYYRSDDRDHTLVYTLGDPAEQILGLDMASQADLDATATALANLGLRVDEGRPDECELRRVRRFVRFVDWTGNQIELVWRADVSGRRYFPSRDAGITGFSHVGLCSSDPARDEELWLGALGARVSDWIGASPLLRLDDIHHRIALFPTQKVGIQHINHQVESIDDIMRSWYFLQSQGIRVVFGPGRHPTSGARFVYFEGHDGMTFEYSCGVRAVEDEQTHRPRQFPAEPSGFCMWGSKPDIAEFKTD